MTCTMGRCVGRRRRATTRDDARRRTYTFGRVCVVCVMCVCVYPSMGTHTHTRMHNDDARDDDDDDDGMQRPTRPRLGASARRGGGDDDAR